MVVLRRQWMAAGRDTLMSAHLASIYRGQMGDVSRLPYSVKEVAVNLRQVSSVLVVSHVVSVTRRIGVGYL